MQAKDFFLWIPRILSIVLAAFLSIFSFDVFGENYAFPEKLLGFFIHLIPTFTIVACLVASWKSPLIGGILFICLGATSMLFFNTNQEIVRFFIVSFPVFLIGCFFIIAFLTKRRLLVRGT